MQNRIIYLAAGNSVRFGENKLLYPVAGKPMYRHGLDLLLSILEEKENYELIVASQYQAIVEAVAAKRQEFCNQGKQPIAKRIHPFLTKNSRLGMSYTIRESIAYGWGLSGKNAAYTDSGVCIRNARRLWQEGRNYDTFMVADQPYMKKESLSAFMEGMMTSGQLVGCVSENGAYGNPVMFSSRIEPELMELRGDCGGKRVMKKHLDSCYLYPVEQECIDIDYKDSYMKQTGRKAGEIYGESGT